MEEESCSENAIFTMSSLGRRRLRVKYVGSKNQKEFLKDLKLVYAADTKEKAETELDHLEDTKLNRSIKTKYLFISIHRQRH